MKKVTQKIVVKVVKDGVPYVISTCSGSVVSRFLKMIPVPEKITGKIAHKIGIYGIQAAIVLGVGKAIRESWSDSLADIVEFVTELFVEEDEDGENGDACVSKEHEITDEDIEAANERVEKLRQRLFARTSEINPDITLDDIKVTIGDNNIDDIEITIGDNDD